MRIWRTFLPHQSILSVPASIAASLMNKIRFADINGARRARTLDRKIGISLWWAVIMITKL